MGKQDVHHGINLNYDIYCATYGTEKPFQTCLPKFLVVSGNDPHKIRLRNTRWK